MRLNKVQKTAVTALEDIKARDITVLDVRKLTSLCDTMIIASAESNRQVKALANHVRERLKQIGATIVGVEGEETGEWVLVDAGDIIVHIMAFSATGLRATLSALDVQRVEYTCRQQKGTGIWQVFVHDPNGAKVELDFSPEEPAPQ